MQVFLGMQSSDHASPPVYTPASFIPNLPAQAQPQIESLSPIGMPPLPVPIAAQNSLAAAIKSEWAPPAQTFEAPSANPASAQNGASMNREARVMR